jgi:hypothetical protein
MSETRRITEQDRLKKIAEALCIPAARRHIFLCADQSTPKCCDHERSLEAWEYLKRRLKELGLSEQGGIQGVPVADYLILEHPLPEP